MGHACLQGAYGTHCVQIAQLLQHFSVRGGVKHQDFFIYQAGFAQGGSGLGTVHTEAADPLVPEKLGQGQCPSAIAVSREVGVNVCPSG